MRLVNVVRTGTKSNLIVQLVNVSGYSLLQINCMTLDSLRFEITTLHLILVLYLSEPQ